MTRRKPAPTTTTPRTYILVGAGGTGSLLFPVLTRYLESYERNTGSKFRLLVVDGDEVSPSNLERQMFFGRFVGSNKAISLLEQYQADPDTIIAFPSYLGADNLNGIAEGDVVLIAVDNFPVRAHIERHCSTLNDVTVINGGNEMRDGSLQTWIRRGGENMTPPMSQGHPELLRPGADRAVMSCQQIAELPGGEQTIIANMMSATLMLNAIERLHHWEQKDAERPHVGAPLPHEEVFFDLTTSAMRATTR